MAKKVISIIIITQFAPDLYITDLSCGWQYCH